MKTLVLITSNFPFGPSDPFPEAEIPLLSGEFERIIIISLNSSSTQTHELPPEIKVFRYNTSTSSKGFLQFPLFLFRNLKLISTIFQNEINFRRKSGAPLSVRQKGYLFKKIIKAIQLRDYINSTLAGQQVSSHVVFYSYWLNSGAHAIGMLDYSDSIKIARAHGSDLYEEKTDHGYLPMLRFVSENLNSIFFISEHGRNYFAEKTGSGKAELNLSRLGTTKPHFELFQPDSESDFIIVSCSNLIPLKRVHLIIESLSLIKADKRIRWIHFGTGPLREELGNLASRYLGSHKQIIFEFRGYVPNKDILDFYNYNHVSLFINTSYTEGLPVSIMEVQSFGIPVIATDTGGVGEIVHAGTGFLLPVDFKPDDLAQKISIVMNMLPLEMESLRSNIILNWHRNFNAASNLPEFIRMVNRIFDTSLKNHG